MSNLILKGTTISSRLALIFKGLRLDRHFRLSFLFKF